MKTYFDIESVLVKSKKTNGEIITGFSFSIMDSAGIRTFVKKCEFKDGTYYCIDEKSNWEEVICDSTCRSTGFFDKNKQLCFEYDLVEITDSYGRFIDYRYIYWDSEFRKWALRTFNCGMRYVERERFSVIGNIALNENDYAKMQKQLDEENKKPFIRDTSTCLSTSYKNKKAKQFLP